MVTTQHTSIPTDRGIIHHVKKVNALLIFYNVKWSKMKEFSQNNQNWLVREDIVYPPQYLKEGFDYDSTLDERYDSTPDERYDSTPDERYDSTPDESPRTLRMDEMTEQERSTGEDYEKEIDEEYGTTPNLTLRTTTTTLQNTFQCKNFPMEPCKKPDQQGFHGLWLYPPKRCRNVAQHR